ncbi:hypothetical protein NFI96_008356, partial [Prochilodus magdalenae]
GGGWSPQLTDRSPWLQLDLRARMEVTAVAVQGRYGSHDWVSAYMLLYSDAARVWKQYRHEDSVGISSGTVCRASWNGFPWRAAASQPYITKRSAECGTQWCKAPPLDSRAVEVCSLE